ncbi:MAG: RHS repeat-associated core domain-containing protein, partial [Chloroflexia bacterium]
AGIGLYFYNARWYDPALGRFVQPDTAMPEPSDPQQLNRFSYARNAPTNYTDPSGHAAEAGAGVALCDYEDLAEAYDRAADQVSPEAYRGWLQDYMARKAVWYMALAEFGATPEDPNVAAYIEDLGKGVTWAQERLLVNGYAGRDVALDTAYRQGGGPVPILETAGALLPAVGAAIWQPGDPINAPTRSGDYPSWSTARRRYWINKALNAEPGKYSEENLARMRQGLAPLDETGQPMHLHHIGGRKIPDPHNLANLASMTAAEHYGIHFGR